MAVQIILKNSTTEDKRPKTLANGEISLNYHADGAFLCCQDTEGNIQQVGGVKISTDAPDAPVKQTLWFNPDTLTLFIFDGDAWFPVGGAGGGGGGGDIIQIIGNDGIDADTIGGIVTLDVELAGGDDGLEFKTSKLSASIASETVLGSVKIGDNIDVSADGTISVDVPQTTTFRGSCILENPPLGQLAPNPPETGDAYINGVATNSIDNGWVNLGGGASAAGDLVIWDGTEWELIQTGGDSLWQRIGTTLEPTVDGDNIATTGKITSASTEDSDSGTTVVTKDYLDTALDNIPDTDNPANQPGTLDDRYVNVIGDNMTGDLTLGTDKITLDASNGNATFAGKATSASTEDTDSDTTLVTKDYLASEIAEGIDDLDAVTEIIPGDGIDTRETDGEVTVSVYLTGTNDGLEFETGKLKATVATASELGSVMIGDGVNVDADGTISVPEAPSVTTSDTPPLAADSSNGDLWWNTNDGRLYIYYTDGDSSQWVDASPDSQTELITNGPSFPTDAEVNDLFFNTTEGRLYIYFDDGNSQQWVDASPQGSADNGDDDTDAFWNRAGGTLFPLNTNDSVSLGSGKVQLSGVDGSATFAGNELKILPTGAVQAAGGNWELFDVGATTQEGSATIQGDAFQGKEIGATIEGGCFRSCQSGSGNYVFEGYQLNTAIPTFRVSSDGSAEFAGDVLVGSSNNIKLDKNGFASFNRTGDSEYGSVSLNVSEQAVHIYDKDNNKTVEINYDGSGEFTGGVECKSVLVQEDANNYGRMEPQGFFLSDRSDGGYSCFRGELNGVVNSEIKANGSATFASRVEAGLDALLGSSIGNAIIARTNTDSSSNTFASVFAMNYNSAGRVWVGHNPGGSPTSEIFGNGSAKFAGTVTATVVPPSDARFKENITPAKPQLADVVALGGLLKNYNWNEDAPLNEELRSVRQLGLIAQEAAEVCPSIVKDIHRTKTVEVTPAVTGPKGRVVKEAVTQEVDDSYKGISTDALIMKLIGAVAELSAEVQALKGKSAGTADI